jgi:hypothetical protein
MELQFPLFCIHKNWNWANCPLTGLKPNTGFNWVEDTITKPEVGVTPVSVTRSNRVLVNNTYTGSKAASSLLCLYQTGPGCERNENRNPTWKYWYTRESTGPTL